MSKMRSIVVRCATRKSPFVRNPLFSFLILFIAVEFMHSTIPYRIRGTLKAHSLCAIVETGVLTNVVPTTTFFVFQNIFPTRKNANEMFLYLFGRTITGNIQHTDVANVAYI